MLNNLAIVSQLMSHSVMIYNTFLFVETPGKFITVMIYCGRSVDIDMNRKIELYFSAVRRSSAGAPAVFPTPEPDFVCRSPEPSFPSSGKMTRKQYEMRQMSNDC